MRLSISVEFSMFDGGGLLCPMYLIDYDSPYLVSVGGRPYKVHGPQDRQPELDRENGEWWKYVSNSSIALANIMAEKAPTGAVLEVACGLALPSLVASANGHDIHCYDIMEVCKKYLHLNSTANGIRPPRWASSFDSIEDGSFDTIIAADTMYMGTSSVGLLEIMLGKVKASGTVILADQQWMQYPRLRDMMDVLTPYIETETVELLPHQQGSIPRHYDTRYILIHKIRKSP